MDKGVEVDDYSVDRVNPFRLIRQIHNEGEGVIYFVPNPGNVGDALIASSTFQLFQKNNLEIRGYADIKRITDRDILVYGGGGNLIPNYRQAERIIDAYHNKVRAFILLPHTVSGCPDLLNTLGSKVHLFCREDVSYAYVSKQAPYANVYRYNDLALGLDINDLRVNWYNGAKALRNYYKGFYSLYTAVSKALAHSNSLYCFRTDREATAVNYERKYNVDVSSYFKFGYYAGKDLTCLLTRYVLYIVNKFEKVYTNRLHMCIAGYLLDKEVYFYPNSYYKNKAVFDSCLKYLSDKIHWTEAEEVLE